MIKAVVPSKATRERVNEWELIQNFFGNGRCPKQPSITLKHTRVVPSSQLVVRYSRWWAKNTTGYSPQQKTKRNTETLQNPKNRAFNFNDNDNEARVWHKNPLSQLVTWGLRKVPKHCCLRITAKTRGWIGLLKQNSNFMLEACVALLLCAWHYRPISCNLPRMMMDIT